MDNVTEEDLAQRLGVPVEEVQDFLHEEIPYEERVVMHDVLSCNHPRCGGGMVEFS